MLIWAYLGTLHTKYKPVITNHLAGGLRMSLMSNTTVHLIRVCYATLLEILKHKSLYLSLPYLIIYHSRLPVPLIAVDLLRICNIILPELQNHLGALLHCPVVALAARQEVRVLMLKVWVVDH